MQVKTEAEDVTRERLLSGFLAAVKVCQVRYGGRTELATESDPRVASLCQCLEETLIHGLRIKIASRGIGAIRQVTDFVSSGLNLHLTLSNTEPEKPVLWWYVREFLTKHEFDRFLLLRNVTTDEGRGRAWLRSLLNEHSLERYIHIMLSDQEYLEQWYEPWALLRDQERSAVLPNLAAGLDSILFAINIDNESFSDGAGKLKGKDNSAENSKPVEPEPHVAQVAENNQPLADDGDSQRKLEIKRKKKKKIPSQLVSFDEEFLSQSYSSYPCESPTLGCFSAPSTSINSPAGTSSDQSISKFNKLVGDEEVKKAKQKLESVISEHSEASMKASVNISEVKNSSKTLPLNRENIQSSETELSYNQALEDLLASEISNESVTTAVFDIRKSEKLKMEHETGSYKSVTSNVSCDSFQSSEDVGGLPSLLPLEGGTGGLIPLSPEGEVLFNVGITQDDETSLKSLSQDEFDMNECSTEDVDKKRMSNSSSVGSVASAGSGPLSSNSKCSTVTPSSFSSLTFDELRTAVLEISRTRDASEQKRAALATALNTEMETSSTLRAQLEQEQAQHVESVDRLSSKVNALTRENELLRHQLKKYIGAVQMLRRDTDNQSGEDSVFSLPSKNPPEIRDYHDEAAAYEKKLIQVAEMHGELMEFNERLQRLLKLRESQVQRLREELVELRGPFPTADEDDDLDETLSVTSDLDSISPSPRTLINIWIPTAFLAGPSSDTHHVYQIYVRIKDDEWNVYRRFAQFYELHKRFKKKDATIRTFDFPQKKAFGNKDISVVEDRRIRLQQYLRQLINFLVSSNQELASQPSKATLTSLLPFLLDSTPPKETSSKNSSRRKFLSRLSTRQELSPPTQSSPQYNGL